MMKEAPEADFGSMQPAIAILMRLRGTELPPICRADVRSILIEGGPASKRARTASRQRVIDELKQIERQAADLAAALSTLHRSTADLFRNLSGIRTTLNILECIARATEVPDPLPPLSRKISGPQMLALAAATVFRMTTGVSPTIINKEGQKAHGVFLEFLDAVFRARGVTDKSSRENAAKWAISSMSKRNVPHRSTMDS